MDINRNAWFEQALEAGASKEPVAQEREHVQQVRRLFDSAKARIKRMIESEGPVDVYVQIGEEGAAVTDSGRDCAIDVLAKACSPLTIGEGIQLQTNAFNAEWQAFCRWALQEELIPELYAVHDERLVRVRHCVRVRAIPV